MGASPAATARIGLAPRLPCGERSRLRRLFGLAESTQALSAGRASPRRCQRATPRRSSTTAAGKLAYATRAAVRQFQGVSLCRCVSARTPLAPRRAARAAARRRAARVAHRLLGNGRRSRRRPRHRRERQGWHHRRQKRSSLPQPRTPRHGPRPFLVRPPLLALGGRYRTVPRGRRLVRRRLRRPRATRLAVPPAAREVGGGAAPLPVVPVLRASRLIASGSARGRPLG